MAKYRITYKLDVEVQLQDEVEAEGFERDGGFISFVDKDCRCRLLVPADIVLQVIRDDVLPPHISGHIEVDGQRWKFCHPLAPFDAPPTVNVTFAGPDGERAAPDITAVITDRLKGRTDVA